MSTRVYATGRRKEASARVWVTPGSGKFIINSREIDAYFNRPVLTWIVKELGDDMKEFELEGNTVQKDY